MVSWPNPGALEQGARAGKQQHADHQAADHRALEHVEQRAPMRAPSIMPTTEGTAIIGSTAPG
jgi:hypothetical protein